MRNGWVLSRRDRLTRLAAVLVILFAAVILMSQTARAQTTYVITDGDRVVYHTTYATDPAEVLSEAGLELRAEDTFTTQADGNLSEITVKRIQMIQVRTASQTVETATYGTTVAEILRQLGISTRGNLRISEDLEAETYDGMVIDVITLECETEDVIRTLPYNTIYCSDATLEPGEERILTQGRDGKIQATVRTTYENGVKAEETTLNESILEAPVNAVVARGVDRSANLAQGGSRDSGGTLTTASGEVISYRKRLSVEATAYSCEGYQGVTALGTTARYGAIAVDPSVIPYGTQMYIVSDDGVYIYGYAVAEDCGGAIRGNMIDLYFDTVEECFEFGRRACTVYILE